MSKKILLFRRSLFGFLLILINFFIPTVVSAHEAYVLDQSFFWRALNQPFNLSSFEALKNIHNLEITIIITIGIIGGLLLNFFLRKTKLGQKVNNFFDSFSEYGPVFVRLAIAVAFFFSAYSNSFLGPELSLAEMPFANLIRILLFVISGMIAVGILTELAAFVALIIFSISFSVFGLYIVTYLNYLGEIVVLLLFGLRKWSVDGFIFGPKKRFLNLIKYDATILRIFYGTALIFAAVTIKLLHPELTIEVVNHWNLTQFHWLFPSDPLLVTFGAALAEIAIGLFIIIGFEIRLTILVSLFYITLSLFFFRELVWPHLMLYGISFALLVQPETFTVDHLLSNRKGMPWNRLFYQSNK